MELSVSSARLSMYSFHTNDSAAHFSTLWAASTSTCSICGNEALGGCMACSPRYCTPKITLLVRRGHAQTLYQAPQLSDPRLHAMVAAFGVKENLPSFHHAPEEGPQPVQRSTFLRKLFGPVDGHMRVPTSPPAVHVCNTNVPRVDNVVLHTHGNVADTWFLCVWPTCLQWRPSLRRRLAHIGCTAP